MNTFGRYLRLTTFGESHGRALGGVLDGVPAGIPIDLEAIQAFLNYRKPGTNLAVSQRQEEDCLEILSGLLPDGMTMGTPIGFFIANKDARSADYSVLRELYRPSHADYTYHQKYGVSPQAGGGRSSARETAVRCVGGAIALQILTRLGVHIYHYIRSIGEIRLPDEDLSDLDLKNVYHSSVRCPHPQWESKLEALLAEVRHSGDSVGAVVDCLVQGVPVGWGSPLYDKLSAHLGFAILSINAVKGIEFGDGFDITTKRGSEANDEIEPSLFEQVNFLSNHSGGIQGGISMGTDIRFSVAFKPTPTIAMKQKTITLSGDAVEFVATGRHDPCVALRGVSVVHAMTALVLLDAYLATRAESPLV